jgi:hypothetical protein
VSRASQWGEDLDWGSKKERSSSRYDVQGGTPWLVVLISEGLRQLVNGSASYTG